MLINTIWSPSPNFRSGRNGKKPIAIVNHITAGLMPGTLSWLKNPKAQASAHYLITKAGEIYQLVKDEDTAWHAGVVNKPNWSLYNGVNPNGITLGIEHEALAGEGLTEAQYQATLYLHRQLIQKWSIPKDKEHIIGHNRIDSVNRVNDPGINFPWDRLFQDLNDELQPGEARINVWGVSMKGVIINDRTYAPVRALAEALGREVLWDDATKTVTIK